MCVLVTRHLDLALGGALLVGAYVPIALTEQGQLPIGLAVALGAVASATLGVSLRLAVFAPLHRRGGRGWEIVIASFGLYLALQGIASILFGDEVHVLRTGPTREILQLADARMTWAQLLLPATALATTLGATILLHYSRFGRHLRCVADDPLLARVVGIATGRVILGATALGYALTGVLGTLAALDVGVAPINGFPMLLGGVVAAVLGGVGRLPGLWLGALGLAVAQQLVAYFGSIRWAEGVTYGLLVAALVLRSREWLAPAGEDET